MLDQQLLGYVVQLVVAALVSFILQGLKNWKYFPFLNTWSARWWKVTVSGIVAAASVAGISFQFNPTIGQLIVTGLTWAAIGNALLAFVGSFASQHLAYEGMVRKAMPPPGLVAALLAVLISEMSVAGCALTSKPTLPTVPAAALSDLAKFAQRVEQAGKIAEQAQQLEIGMHTLGYLPNPMHVGIQRRLLALSVSVQAGVDLAATTLSPQRARDALTAISAALARVEADAQAITNPTVRSVLQSMVSTIRVVLQFLPATGPPASAVAKWHALVLEYGGELRRSTGSRSC